MWISVNLKLPKATQRNLSWKKKRRIYLVCVCMCVPPVCSVDSHGGQKTASEPTELSIVRAGSQSQKSGSLQEYFVLLISEHLFST